MVHLITSRAEKPKPAFEALNLDHGERLLAIQIHNALGLPQVRSGVPVTEAQAHAINVLVHALRQTRDHVRDYALKKALEVVKGSRSATDSEAAIRKMLLNPQEYDLG